MTEDALNVFKALSDRTRFEIVLFLIGRKECSCQELSLQFDLSQPTLSHHFARLKEAGVIHVRREGVAHYYRVDRQYLRGIGIDLKKMAVNLKNEAIA